MELVASTWVQQYASVRMIKDYIAKLGGGGGGGVLEASGRFTAELVDLLKDAREKDDKYLREVFYLADRSGMDFAQYREKHNEFPMWCVPTPNRTLEFLLCAGFVGGLLSTRGRFGFGSFEEILDESSWDITEWAIENLQMPFLNPTVFDEVPLCHIKRGTGSKSNLNSLAFPSLEFGDACGVSVFAEAGKGDGKLCAPCSG
ncbi:hypothetical protein DVH05_021639 [Phytophthora capsici]|nr:hypothetical protein DVH05_021639 [Phytophthora capsici]